MKYGHFDDTRKEYVIDRPDTPMPWSNYLGSTEYGAIITGNAGGYSFFRSAAQGRFSRWTFHTLPMDPPGRYFYLRDRATGETWSASWQPVGRDLDTYRSTCRHGTAYTIIESECSGIASEATYFVPLGRHFECWLLNLTNTGDRRRELSVFTYMEFATDWRLLQDLVNQQWNQHITRGDVIDGMLQISVLHNAPEDPENFQNPDQGRFVFLGLVGAEASGFDTSREAFIGPYRSYANPIVVEQGRAAHSLADGDNGCGSFQVDLALEPGESRELMVIVGVGRARASAPRAAAGPQTGEQVLSEFDSPAKAREALEELKAFWHARLGRLTCRTPDAGFDSMINVWNAYNCLITYAWSRAASLVYAGERDGLGYRDTVQDILGILPAIPAEAGERLELMITGQCANGGALPLVKPFAHQPGSMPTPKPEEFRSDDALWLFLAVPAYVKETGDLGFYEKVLPYADHGEATVLGHLRRALEFNLERTGAHGLPCGLLADWNDCLELGFGGESVFVAFQVRYGLREYVDICERLGGKGEEVAWAQARLDELDRTLQEHAWDGRWFLRAYRDEGDGTTSPIGTARDEEGSIFLNAQSWAILSGAATEQQARSAMDGVAEHLETDYGLKVCAPPFRKADYHVVRAVLANPGQKENGGIFNHTQGWAVMAECTLARAQRAWDLYRKYMPAAYNDRAEVRQIEPYVHCQSTHAQESRRHGASRIPWLSGTAAWSYYAGTQYILGLQPDYDGLRIDPHLPADWSEIRLHRTFRDRQFEITVVNGETGCGVRAMTLNGEPVEGNLLPIDRCGEHNEVRVELE